MANKSTTAEILASRIEQVLESFNQSDVARACGVSKQAVYNWKKTGRIDKLHLLEFARMTGISIQYLLGADIPGNESAAEQELLMLFRALPEEKKQLLIDSARSTYSETYKNGITHSGPLCAQQKVTKYETHGDKQK